MELLQLPNTIAIKWAVQVDELYKSVLHIDTLENWTPDMCLCKWYVGYVEGIPVGFIVIKQMTNCLWEFHGGIYKAFRGQALKYLQLSLNIIRKELNCKFMTTVPQKNKLAIVVNEKLGLQKIGVITNGYGDNDLLIYAENK